MATTQAVPPTSAPCDASPGVKNNVASDALLEPYDATLADYASPPTNLPFQNPGPFVRSFEWRANEDVLVEFNVTLARPANQGFFVSAVTFGNIFCSAKLNRCVGANDDGTCQRDNLRLHDASGERGSTVVMAFACAAGNAGTDTFLYMGPRDRRHGLRLRRWQRRDRHVPLNGAAGPSATARWSRRASQKAPATSARGSAARARASRTT